MIKSKEIEIEEFNIENIDLKDKLLKLEQKIKNKEKKFIEIENNMIIAFKVLEEK